MSIDFIKKLKPLRQRISKREPQWLNDFRNQGISQFEKFGFPSIKDEEWKYTNVSAIKEKTFYAPENFKILESEAFNNYIDPDAINIVFVNGGLSREYSNLSKLPEGISVVNFLEAAQKDDTNIQSLLLKQAQENDDAFSALNRVFLNHGAFIKIDDKIHCPKLVHIIHITSGTKNDTIFFPRSLIMMEKSSEAQVLESHICFSDLHYFSDVVTDIFLKGNANLRYCKAQSESPHAFHIGSTRVWQARDSQFEGFSFTTGGRLTRNNLTVMLTEEGTSATIHGLYAVHASQHVDNHTAVHHIAPNCTSNQLYKGILTENARGVFNGKIFVRKEAQKTNSYQLNKNLLLSRACQVDTKPQLEISADDVKCTHGATIGQLNEDEIFYFQTRCIKKDLAVRMLSQGFVDDILNHIQSDVVRGKLNKLLEKFFSII